MVLPFNNIKGSLVAPESSWGYSFSRLIHIPKNPESLQNHLNHIGIIAESYLNHSVREATRGGTRSPYGRRMCPWEVSFGVSLSSVDASHTRETQISDCACSMEKGAQWLIRSPSRSTSFCTRCLKARQRPSTFKVWLISSTTLFKRVANCSGVSSQSFVILFRASLCRIHDTAVSCNSTS